MLISAQSHKAWQICRHCGELLQRLDSTEEQALFCPHCQMPLPFAQTRWVQPATALSLAAVVLFVISNSFDFLSLKLVGFEQSASIISGVGALLAHQQWLLAALVFSTIFLFPLLEISALLYLLVPFQLRKKLPGQVAVLRWLIRAQPWSMLEIFLLAILVTSVKLGDMASLVPGISMYAFFSLVPILNIAYALIDRQSLWNYLISENCYVAKASDKLYACNVCEAMVGETLLDHSPHCPRCFSPMHKRIPNSLQKTTALLAASVILYIPANTLTFMTTRTLTGDRDDTLISGVIALMNHGMWLIAAVVFIASIVVPMAKLGVLIYLLASAHWKHYRNQATKIRLYHLTELIGRWSMVDVYVVTLLTALVQFGFLGNVQPGNALVAFAAVVVLTMLAAEAFDPRLLDSPQEQPGDFPAHAFEHDTR